MASSSASISHSESNSDTYIPEYSQTPILMEIAQHARDMSDVVYQKGLELFNKNQGDIDALMEKALLYASPQRIKADMSRAEAGVQLAAERGRLSAIRDMQSYGIDMSSGKALHEAMAARNISSIAAAGAGNQQAMATEAASNAMRNQAIAAGLQNANYMSGVNKDSNAFLNTASQLKYPPLGRYSNSVSDSQSMSGSGDGGGSKGGDKPKEDKPPAQGGGKEAAPKQEKPVKPPPTKDKEPNKPKGKKEEEDDEPKLPEDMEAQKPFDNPLGTETESQPFQGAYDPSGTLTGISPEMQYGGPYANMGIGPNGEVPALGSGSQTPNWPDWNPATNPNTSAPPSAENMGVGPDGSTPAVGSAGQTPNWPDPTQTATGPEAQSGMDMEFNPWANTPDQTAPPTGGDTMVDSGYNPYQDNIQNALFTDNQNIDPTTGQPVERRGDETNTSDPAGSLYGVDPSGGGDWTLDVDQPTAADWGGTQTTDFGSQTGAYDSAYDNWTDPDTGAGFQLSDYQDTGGDFQPEAPGVDPNPTDFGPEGQWDYEYEDQQPAPDSGAGDDGQWDYEYDDQNQDDYSFDPNYDYTDEGDYEDYEDDYEYDDAGDDSYDDYTDDEASDDGEDDDYYEDDSGGGDYEDSGSDDGYARGGPVRQRGGSMGPRRPMPTGYNTMQQPRRLDPPPQPPRAMRGAPQMARGGPRPAPMGRGMGGPGAMAPGNFISANGMPAPSSGGMPRPQRMAGGGAAGRRPEPTQGGFVSRELSPSGGSKVDDVEARLNAGEFVIPKDVATWKGKEFFYKLIAQARKLRSGDGGAQKPQQPQRPQSGYGQPRGMR